MSKKGTICNYFENEEGCCRHYTGDKNNIGACRSQCKKFDSDNKGKHFKVELEKQITGFLTPYES